VVQLVFLSGKLAGTSWVARRFPVRIGRAASSDLRIEDPGVWNEHLTLELTPAKTFSLTVQPEAITSVNGKPTAQTVLRNGDTIELGDVKLLFWLKQAHQKGLRVGEGLPGWPSWLSR